ncbi:hypothetical protein [Pseudogemmobacter faecipullorum]|uniref:Uncharacterized protein n=1 Tax=Pseudogemmobacter faecipullorum TaxID=2755041 RepID=A0ABS8CQ27_9RHOB|nr:hypothetical protein [Pseudogemmobacter faecipullorum]MCB5411496.1 hypothetical protein [Pseudogemmobacter faecipullorum]
MSPIRREHLSRSIQSATTTVDLIAIAEALHVEGELTVELQAVIHRRRAEIDRGQG